MKAVKTIRIGSLLRHIQTVLEIALMVSPDPKDYCIEIHKPRARGLIRRIKNAREQMRGAQ